MKKWAWKHRTILEWVIPGNFQNVFDRIYGSIVDNALVKDLSCLPDRHIESKLWPQEGIITDKEGENQRVIE